MPELSTEKRNVEKLKTTFDNQYLTGKNKNKNGGLTEMPFAFRQKKGQMVQLKRRTCVHYVVLIRKTNVFDCSELNILEGLCRVYPWRRNVYTYLEFPNDEWKFDRVICGY